MKIINFLKYPLVQMPASIEEKPIYQKKICLKK